MSKSYKIYAKKGKKTMPIKIESKHFYSNPYQSLYIYRPTNNVQNQEANNGYNISSRNVWVAWKSNNVTIPQGTGEVGRIGNKVNIKGVNCSMIVSLTPTNLINYFGHGDLVDLEFKFRIMAVKFNKPLNDDTVDLADWFRETFIYTRVQTGTGIGVLCQSVWTDKLRDSTKYTGSFKILKDKKFTLSKSHSSTQFNFNLGLNREVNFENDNNRPTVEQKFNNIYIFVISPCWYELDMDTISRSGALSITEGQGQVSLFNLAANIKTIYYDM